MQILFIISVFIVICILFGFIRAMVAKATVNVFDLVNVIFSASSTFLLYSYKFI